MSTRRFIVYQYGKVGSTSLVAALNRLENVEAFQSHFLGQDAFFDTIKRLLTAGLDDYFFENSLGQLVANIKVYRHFINKYHGVSEERLTVLTACREPFDRFRSAVTQDIQGHLTSLRAMLDKRGIVHEQDHETIGRGWISFSAGFAARLSIMDPRMIYARVSDTRIFVRTWITLIWKTFKH